MSARTAASGDATFLTRPDAAPYNALGNGDHPDSMHLSGDDQGLEYNNNVLMATRLHFKQREMTEMDVRLNGVKEDVHDRLKAVKVRERRFLTKKAETVDTLARFRYFVQESDAKRQRAERDADDEREIIRKEDATIEILEAQLTQLNAKKTALQEQLTLYLPDKQYLTQVVLESKSQQSEVYTDAKDITTRHKLLVNTNRDLHNNSQKLTLEMQKTHSELQVMLKDSMTTMQLKSSSLARLMKKLEDCRTTCSGIEAQINLSEVRANDNQRVFMEVNMAIRNIESRATNYPTTIRVKPEKIQETATVPYLMELLDVIGEKVVMMKGIYEGVTGHSLNMGININKRYDLKGLKERQSRVASRTQTSGIRTRPRTSGYRNKNNNNGNGKQKHSARGRGSGSKSRPSSSQSRRGSDASSTASGIFSLGSRSKVGGPLSLATLEEAPNWNRMTSGESDMSGASTARGNNTPTFNIRKRFATQPVNKVRASTSHSQRARRKSGSRVPPVRATSRLARAMESGIASDRTRRNQPKRGSLNLGRPRTFSDVDPSSSDFEYSVPSTPRQGGGGGGGGLFAAGPLINAWG